MEDGGAGEAGPAFSDGSGNILHPGRDGGGIFMPGGPVVEEQGDGGVRDRLKVGVWAPQLGLLGVTPSEDGVGIRGSRNVVDLEDPVGGRGTFVSGSNSTFHNLNISDNLSSI